MLKIGKEEILMNIEGLTVKEISDKIMPHMVNYFRGCKLAEPDSGIFAENYQFGFSEIQDLIPVKYHGRYKDSDMFNGACGFVRFESVADKFKDSTYTAMLISDKNNMRLLLLYIKEETHTKNSSRDILLADFLE